MLPTESDEIVVTEAANEDQRLKPSSRVSRLERQSIVTDTESKMMKLSNEGKLDLLKVPGQPKQEIVSHEDLTLTIKQRDKH